MVLKLKLKYHHLLLGVLLLFCWAMLFCSLGFQYSREKQFKIELINSKLQIYNEQLISKYNQGVNLSEVKVPFNTIRISVISISGDVIYDSKNDPKKLNNHHNRPEVMQALKDGSGYSIERMSNSDGNQYFYSATRSGDIILRTAVPYTESLKEMLSADMAFLWFMFVVTLIMSLLGWLVMRQLGQTITRLNRFAAKAERGDKIDNSEIFPHNELGEISKHIINLYTELQDTIVDRDMQYKQALQQEQDKIRIKRQLTNNINHELKTPVASMQLCLETLLLGPQLNDDMKHKLLEQCYSNCERLRNLLNDVSLITRLEEGSMLIQKQKVVINDIVDEIKDEIELMPLDNRFTLHIDMSERVVVNGNQSLIASIFRNLTENAMAYSGGKNIYIRLVEYENEYCKFIFEDDGVGVEEMHLPHLFERFYRVDKGRSRKHGGTGLGLSIVKHAVKFHGGEINVGKSEKGGLKFTFSLNV